MHGGRTFCYPSSLSQEEEQTVQAKATLPQKQCQRVAFYSLKVFPLLAALVNHSPTCITSANVLSSRCAPSKPFRGVLTAAMLPSIVGEDGSFAEAQFSS